VPGFMCRMMELYVPGFICTIMGAVCAGVYLYNDWGCMCRGLVVQ